MVIIDPSYMTMGTANEPGDPGVAGVLRARGIYGVPWVSSPETTHSRSFATRPPVSIVISTGAGGPVSPGAEALRGQTAVR